MAEQRVAPADSGAQARQATDQEAVWAFPDPTGTDGASCWRDVQQIYQYARRECQEAINWYWSKRAPKKRRAVGLRLLAIALLSLGTLAPLLAAGGIRSLGKVEVIWLGYICLAAAGTCVGADKVLGFSADWMRYITTALTLQRILDQFLFKWAISITEVPSACPEAGKRVQLLGLVRDFVQQVRREVERETSEWATQYRKSLADIEKAVGDQLKQARTEGSQGES